MKERGRKAKKAKKNEKDKQIKVEVAFLWCNLRSHCDLQFCKIDCFDHLSTNRRSSIGKNVGVTVSACW